jgi:hypothetical protein
MKVKQMIVSSNARFIPTLLFCFLYVIFWCCKMMLRHPQLRPDPRWFKFLLWRPWRRSQPYFIEDVGERARAAQKVIDALPKLMPRLLKRSKVLHSAFFYLDVENFLPPGWWWYPYEDQKVLRSNPLAVRLTPEEHKKDALAQIPGWDHQPRHQYTSRLKVTEPGSADEFLDSAQWEALLVIRSLLGGRGMEFWIHEFCEHVLPHLGPGPFYVRLLAIDLNIRLDESSV